MSWSNKDRIGKTHTFDKKLYRDYKKFCRDKGFTISYRLEALIRKDLRGVMSDERAGE